MIKVDQVSLPIKYTQKDIVASVGKTLKVPLEKIKSVELIKLSIDARKKPNVKYIASVGVVLDGGLENRFKNLAFVKNTKTLNYKQKQLELSPVVVGFGPSGMFTALALARMGLKPIVVEQGKPVDEREQDVKNFWQNRIVNKYSNVQFGEGGAGTFSDGKLNTNLNNDYCKMVINEFFNFGAPQEITYINKPHIGSDKLKTVVKNIREHIKSLGGKFLFNTKFVDFETKNDKIDSIIVQNTLSNDRSAIKTSHLLLCVGHSARETFELLYNKKVVLQQKPFAMGVRIEQKQKDINLSQYGAEYVDGLPNADYKLVAHLPNGRSVFTFCMCPGGEIVASSSGEGEVVTNGMSNFARDKENANSAVLVNVTPQDYGSDNPLAGVYYQASFEKKAFELAGSNFNAPAESVGSFVKDKNIATDINYTYRPGLTMCKIKDCLPDFVTKSLKLGLPILNQKLRGFAKDENLLVAIESRSSCPLTIVRDEDYQSSTKGIYPIGEGAGYAGGIMSSAQDGIKVAESIYNSLKKIKKKT